MPTALLDPGRDDDRHIGERLAAEPIVWLGTVRPDGRPHSVPVWFLWDDPTVLLFSPSTAQKVTNIRANPVVSLHLDSAAGGSDIVLADGVAELVDDPTVRPTHPGFAAKYGPLLSMPSFDDWGAIFAQPVLVTVTRLVGWISTPEGVRSRVLVGS